MRVQDFISDLTTEYLEKFIAEAKKVPADKLEWKPLDEGRTVLSMMQELAVVAGAIPDALATFQTPPFDEEVVSQYQNACRALDTFEKAEAALRENTDLALTALENVKGEDLERSMTFYMPTPRTVLEVMMHHASNIQYHTGQVCYIQTLYGDHS